jgi:leucyl aminopeptidase (aminopeptidase T)
LRLLAGLLALPLLAQLSPLNYPRIADRLIGALNLSPGERVLIPTDPGYFDALIPALEARIQKAGAKPIRIEWSPKGAQRPGRSIRDLLEETDVFLWLPFRTNFREVTQQESRDIARWTDLGGTRRQIHFHWDQGSVEADGLAGEHTAALDKVYESALAIDYRAMAAAQQRAATRLAAAQVRVTTPAGTNLRFEIRDRPFNRQDGVATAKRMESAKVRVDREIEFPSGVLRVAPIEETANGVLVVPEARFGGTVTKNLRLEFKDGKVSSMIASEALAAVQNELQAAGDAAFRFREFGMGFNPRLRPLKGSRILPYFAYGAGMVRISLGDNEELGGAIRGGYRRWFFLPDATVTVGTRTLVRAGVLAP